MNILGIDTSGGTCCVALLSDGVLLGDFNINYKKTHSQVLMPLMDNLRAMTDFDLGDLDAIAVAAGPGSFTGLRIGSATAKGLGLALNKPIIPVPTLEAIAYRVYGFGGLICPIMDARRSQVYTGVYEFVPGDDNRLELKNLHPQAAVPIEEIAGICNELAVTGDNKGNEHVRDMTTNSDNYSGQNRNDKKQVIFLGDGVPVFKERLKELMKVPYLTAPAHIMLQNGGAVAGRGEELFRAGIHESAAEHKPIYLRKPQAQREREAQLHQVE